MVRLEGDGSARLTPEAGGRAVYLPPEDARRLKNGEHITIRLEVGRKGRVHGRLVARGTRRGPEVVGVVRRAGRALLLEPTPEGPALLVHEAGGAAEGDAVIAHVSREGHHAEPAQARVTQVLGRAREPRVEVELLVRAQGLPMAFPPEALAQAREAPPVEPRRVLAERDGDVARRDLRQVLHVTIDGEDARDFDDAVSARREGGGIRIWVSIADVSHYVIEGSPLDVEAEARGTSVYFPDRVIPMLPEELSNHLCSLRPGEPRLTLTCEAHVTPAGRLEQVEVYPSLIQSAARLTYNQVQEALDSGSGPAAGIATLPELAQAARWIRARRDQRGAIDLDLPEAYVLMGPDGVARHIRERQRLFAHRLIEDLMIAANEAVAELFIERRWPGVFRIHEPPDPLRLAQLDAWGRNFGLGFDVRAAEQPRELQRLAVAMKGKPFGAAGQVLLLRSLAQARYSRENVGHYGLASRAYAHFTSPIRRYPDLLVHRSLRALWRGAPRLRGLEGLAAHASLRERRAMEAERAVVQLMSCHVARDHVGDELTCVVTGVHRAGAFVRAKEVFVEGLLGMRTLGRGGDYYDVDERHQCLIARRSGHRIAVGDTLSLRLTGVDTARRTIDFEPARPFEPRRGPPGRGPEATARPRAEDRRQAPPRGRRTRSSGRSRQKPRGSRK